MLSNWKVCKIGDICKRITSGGTPKSTVIEYYNAGNIPWLNTKEVHFNRIYTTEKNITEFGLNNSSAKWIKENNVIVAMYGVTAGNVAINKIPLTTNQACCNLEINDKVADYNFIYYLLMNNYNLLSSMANGGAQQNLNSLQIKNFSACLPPLETQKKIAKVLSAFDDKIELNNKMNENLEQQAQAIFKSWFIDFEPFGGKMPADWKKGTFSELIDYAIGGDWGKEKIHENYTEKVYCIRGADIPDVRNGNKGKMPFRYILPKNYENKKLSNGDLVVEISGGSPTQSTGRIAVITDYLLNRYDNKIVCTNFCRALKPKKDYSMFIYYYWLYMYSKDVFFSYENGTTGIKNFDITGFLETEKIVIPNEEVLKKFSNLCISFEKQIFSNGYENEQLANLRDTLLPKLINGEIEL